MPARLVKNLKTPPRKMVVLTPEQNKYVLKIAKRGKLSQSEALRQIIQKAKDAEDYEKKLMRLLAE